MPDRVALIRQIAEQLQAAPLRLALVVARHGSAPCVVGDLLLLDQTGQVRGTVGGGRLEQEVLDNLQCLLPDGGGSLRHFNLVPEQDGMPCGGAVTVLLARLQPALQPYFASVYRCLQQGMTVKLRIAVDVTGQVDWLKADKSAAEGQLFEIPVAPTPELLIFGAGHITQALAPMAQVAGFTVTVLDDRADYLTAHPFAAGIEVVCLERFEKVFSGREAGVNSFLVIATYDHDHDRTVLEQTLATGAIYIGMVGSRRKREELFGHLRQAGCSETNLARVHCPVGLAIGAESPAEIAVSILAQMISVRRGRG